MNLTLKINNLEVIKARLTRTEEVGDARLRRKEIHKALVEVINELQKYLEELRDEGKKS